MDGLAPEVAIGEVVTSLNAPGTFGLHTHMPHHQCNNDACNTTTYAIWPPAPGDHLCNTATCAQQSAPCRWPQRLPWAACHIGCCSRHVALNKIRLEFRELQA